SYDIPAVDMNFAEISRDSSTSVGMTKNGIRCAHLTTRTIYGYPRKGSRRCSNKCAHKFLRSEHLCTRSYFGRQACTKNNSPQIASRSLQRCHLCRVRSSAVDGAPELALRQFDIVSADTRSPVDRCDRTDAENCADRSKTNSKPKRRLARCNPSDCFRVADCGLRHSTLRS